MYRMRRWSSPSSVTRPPPSSTTAGDVLTTFAGAVIGIEIGSEPQSNVITPLRRRWATRVRRALRVLHEG